MGTIRDLANIVYADGPVGAENNPRKDGPEGIRALFAEIEDQIEGAQEGFVFAPTWPDLAAVTGGQEWQRAEVPTSDGGTHTDPVVGGTVANSGRYTWSTSPAGWQRIADSPATADEIEEATATAQGASSAASSYLSQIQSLAAQVLTFSPVNSLVGGGNGVGANFVGNSVAVVGGSSPETGLPEDVFTHTRASVADYVDADGYVKQAASGDWLLSRDPLTGETLGAFIGAAADNLLTQYDDMTHADWVKTSVSVTAGAGIGPDGTSSAFQVADTSASVIGTISQTKTGVGLSANGYATFSAFVKNVDFSAGELMQFNPALSGGTTVSAVVDYNPVTRELGAMASATAKATLYRDGWTRVDVIVQNNGSANNNLIWRARWTKGNAASQRSLLFWKPTMHLGSRWLGTVDGRAADVITKPLSELDWNAQSGSLVVDFDAVPFANDEVVLAMVDNGTGSKRITLEVDDSGQVMATVDDGTTTVLLASGDTAHQLGGRAAVTWTSQGVVKLFFDGEEVDSETGVSLPTGLTTLRIGSDWSGNRQPNCHIGMFIHRPYAMSGEEIAAAGDLSSGGAGGGSTTEFSDAEIEAYNAWTMAETAAVVANGNPNIAKFLPGLNWVMEYGQSLSVGAVAHPPRTTTMLYDAMMIGNSVRPKADAAAFTPFGSLTLNPLEATVDIIGTDAVLTPSEIEALAWDDVHTGETISIGFVEMAKYLWNQHRAEENDATRKFVVTSTGKGGTEISALADTSNYRYQRTVDAAAQLKALATAAALNSYHAVVLWGQGESDYISTTLAAYKAAFLGLQDDIYTDATAGEFGQVRRAPWFFYQIGARWTEDDADIAIHRAQLELATEEPADSRQRDIFCYGASYPVTNKPDGHLDANGSRWLGCMAAKCWYRVVVKGEGWKPLHIRKAVTRARKALLMYHTPVPPLTFRDAYVGFTATSYGNKGFRAVDGVGEVAITSVSIVRDSTIQINFGRDIVGDLNIYYGSEATYAGNGNVFDSDRFEALFNYEYLPDAGDDASANVAALVDRPYPLNNPAMIQKITAEAV